MFVMCWREQEYGLLLHLTSCERRVLSMGKNGKTTNLMLLKYISNISAEDNDVTENSIMKVANLITNFAK